MFSGNKRAREMFPGKLSEELQSAMEKKADAQGGAGQPLDSDTEGLAEKHREEQPCLAITQQQTAQVQQESLGRDGTLPGWNRLELHDSQFRDLEIGLIMAAIESVQGMATVG